MSRIAVVGPGAVGGTVAAWLCRAGCHDVTLCARTPLDRLSVDTPEGRIEAEPRVLTDPADAGPVDWVLAATKTYDEDGAAAWISRLIGDGTRVAVLQNGVEHRRRFAGIVPPDQIVPAIVDIPAERNAPGSILQRRLGSILVPDDEPGRAFVALFEGVPIEVRTTPDFVTAAWRKLALNCAGAVNALALKPAEVARDEAVAEAMRGLIRECIAVGRAEGADLPDGLVEEVIEGARAADPNSVNSLLADRLARRRTEWDARNGIIVRLGRRHGIATPLNAMAAALLAAADPS